MRFASVCAALRVWVGVRFLFELIESVNGKLKGGGRLIKDVTYVRATGASGVY